MAAYEGIDYAKGTIVDLLMESELISGEIVAVGASGHYIVRCDDGKNRSYHHSEIEPIERVDSALDDGREVACSECGDWHPRNDMRCPIVNGSIDTKPAEVWCSDCEQPSVVEDAEFGPLCVGHVHLVAMGLRGRATRLMMAAGLDPIDGTPRAAIVAGVATFDAPAGAGHSVEADRG